MKATQNPAAWRPWFGRTCGDKREKQICSWSHFTSFKVRFYMTELEKNKNRVSETSLGLDGACLLLAGFLGTPAEPLWAQALQGAEHGGLHMTGPSTPRLAHHRHSGMLNSQLGRISHRTEEESMVPSTSLKAVHSPGPGTTTH